MIDKKIVNECKICRHKEIKETYHCDVCKKEISKFDYEKAESNVILVTQHAHWAENDNQDYFGIACFCSIECLKRITELENIGDSLDNGINKDEGYTFELECNSNIFRKIIGNKYGDKIYVDGAKGIPTEKDPYLNKDEKKKKRPIVGLTMGPMM